MLHLPNPISEPDPIALPTDVPFPGTIRLEVDATDTLRGIFQVVETIPVSTAGPLTLLYPKWLPGYHSPQASIESLSGLQIFAAGEQLPWQRDAVEVFGFHVDVPEGVESIELRFQFVSPTTPAQGRVTVTPEMLNLHWNAVVLYPAGYFSRRIHVDASLIIPDGWELACVLERTASKGGKTTFAPCALDVLVDSPVMAGRHFRRIELDADGSVALNLVADRADLLAATDEQMKAFRQLITQADRLFGTRPFDRFEFLMALSDELGSIGVEHHRSCEIGTDPTFFTAWDTHLTKRDVISHEYTHSWNGKFRRGEDSWTPSFERPIRNSLMWVYEGQTQYWGQVLSTRAGLWTKQNALDAFAQTAATYDMRAGRRWRPMIDTTRDPIIANRSPLPWMSWQRSEDYYSEGQLMWLDVDTLIREISGDRRSLDDFAQSFFGMAEGSFVTNTYGFHDVVRTLDRIATYDWAGYLKDKLERTGGGPPLDWLERGGYRLVYRDRQSEFSASGNAASNLIDLTFSVGVSVGSGGLLQEVIWDSPAFAAGLTAGSTLIAVNGCAYEAEELRHAIVQAQHGEPLEVLVKSGKRVRTARLDYTGGLAYPHLEPIEGARGRIDEILAARE